MRKSYSRNKLIRKMDWKTQVIYWLGYTHGTIVKMRRK